MRETSTGLDDASASEDVVSVTPKDRKRRMEEEIKNIKPKKINVACACCVSRAWE